MSRNEKETTAMTRQLAIIAACVLLIVGVALGWFASSLQNNRYEDVALGDGAIHLLFDRRTGDLYYFGGRSNVVTTMVGAKSGSLTPPLRWTKLASLRGN